MPKKCLIKLKPTGMCNKPTQLQFQSTLNTENFDDPKRYVSTGLDRKTWLHVPSGYLWSTSSDTHYVVEI